MESMAHRTETRNITAMTIKVLAISFVMLCPMFIPGSAGIDPRPPSRIELEIELEHHISHTTIEGIAHREILLIDGGITRAEGGYRIPFYSRMLSVPGTISDIDVRFEDPSTFDIPAAPWTVPSIIGHRSEIDPEWDPNSHLKNVECYEIIDLGRGSPNGDRLYSLRLYPVRFQGEGSSILHSKVMVSIDHAPLHLGAFNAERKPFGPIKYLIITHEDLEDELIPFAEWKSQKGLFTRILTTEYIGSAYEGKDLAMKMRNCVMDIEHRHDLDYLLIVGDYDKVPTRYSYNDYPYTAYGEPGYYATDGYFACVDAGTTWNKDNDANYAEPGEIDDPVPDMAVGRLAINSPSVLRSVLSDLIQRDKELPYSSYNNIPIYMVGNPNPNPGNPVNVMGHFWDDYGKDVFDDRETMHYDGTGTMSFSKSSVKKVMDDRHQFMGYFSHGTPTDIPNLYDRNDVPDLSGNGHAGVFFAMACSTGWFDKPGTGANYFSGDCLAEVLTETPKKGVAGYIGASRLAVGHIDTTYSGDAPGLMEDYWRGVMEAMNGNLNSTSGDIYRYAITRFASNFHPFPGGASDGSLRTYLEYNLLGEPDAPLIIREPEALSLTFDLSTDLTYVKARVLDSGGSPVEGVTVTICRLAELGISALTDGHGEVNINIPPSNGGNISITAYRRGDLPSTSYFELPDELPPLALLAISPEAPDGLNGYYRTTPLLVIGADEEVEVEYVLDGQGSVFCPDNEVIPLNDGEHELAYRVKDGAGHRSDWDSISLKIDTTPPELQIDTDPHLPDGQGGWFITSPAISLNASEDIFDVGISIDDGFWMGYAGDIDLEEGVTKVAFKGRDIAGNWNTTSMVLRIDSTAPISSMFVSHSPDGLNGYYVTAPTIELRTHDPNSAQLEYRWDDGHLAQYSDQFEAPEGIHVLHYRARDAPGNVEEWRTVEFKVDTVRPSFGISVAPEAPDGLNGYYRSSPIVNASWSDGILLYALRAEGYEVSWPLHGRDWSGPLTIPEGNWTLLLKCQDVAGNMIVSGPHFFSVDLTPPSIDLDIWPEMPDGSNGWYVTSPSITATAGADDDLFYRILPDEDWTRYKETLFIEAENTRLEFKARDRAGNENVVQAPLIRYDPVPPWVSITSPSSGDVLGGGRAIITWTGGDNVMDGLTYWLKVDGDEFLPLGYALSHDLSGISDGKHHVILRAIDDAGNRAESWIIFNMDSTPPQVTAYAPMGDAVNELSDISVTFSEAMDRDSVFFEIEGVSGTVRWSLSEAVLTPSEPLSKGSTYNITVRGRDLYGNELAPFSWEFTTVGEPEVPAEDKGAPIGLIAAIAVSSIIVLCALAALFLLFLRRRRQYDEMEFFE